MSTFLKLLPLELDQVTDLIEPSSSLESGENVVGTVPEFLKRLYTLWMSKAKLEDEIMVQARYETNEELARDLRVRAGELQDKSKVLRLLFWIGLKDEFSLWDKEELGVRRDWQVIWKESAHGFGDFLRGLMGGEL